MEKLVVATCSLELLNLLVQNYLCLPHTMIRVLFVLMLQYFYDAIGQYVDPIAYEFGMHIANELDKMALSN